MPDCGVVRGGESFVDSYIVPLSRIGQAEQHYYRGVIAMFLIFLDDRLPIWIGTRVADLHGSRSKE